ncbi:MAG: TonB-dependent receptor [Bacteroidetes bacterium]|nr:TonB-dependent receptor [Bacteroidota bacterium]MDA1018973.1 TonB-dependent receptor [Bacteroidota bacterium]
MYRFKATLLKFIFLLFSFINYSQENFTISGYVLDKDSNESIIGANIIIPSINSGTITNTYGFFSLTLPKENYAIEISSIGYKNISTKINLLKNINTTFFLTENVENLEEVVVIKDVEEIDITKPVMSLNILSNQTIKQTPVLFGESDVLKTIQLLPGVSNAGEGTGGFNVRGGSADQNLILFDEAIIYSSSHLFGLFSIFNSDAIKEVKLFKGGIPSSYGGRLSSVLDVYQKDGNSKKHKLSGGIGIISSRILGEGPIKMNKGSYLVATRGSYAHLFLKFTDIENVAYFYDINSKLNYKIDKNNTFYFSGYFGRDKFKLNNTFSNTYGNSTLNLRWNHIINEKIFSNTSLIFSDYYYGLTLNFVGFDWNSGIKNLNIKFDLKNYYSNKIQFNYGLNSIYYEFNPGLIKPINQSGINFTKLERKFALENAAYFDVVHKVSPKMSLRYGFRVNQFSRFKQEGLNRYLNDNSVTYDQDLGIYKEAKIIGEYQNPNDSKTIKSFYNFEPRFNFSYNFNNQSLKASYNRLNQYIHLISNTNAPAPLDVWAPSGPYLKPQQLDQLALGYHSKLKNGNKLETEVFYKKIKNRLDYIPGADLVANEAVERVLLAGKARAYGLEFLFKKNKGRHNYWIAYTLSKSEQKTEGRNDTETGINGGNWYNTGYDKTHDFSFVSNFKLNDKLTFNANFIFQTGQPVNYPTGQYTYMDLIIPNYGERNSNRLPNYHRLDISLTLNSYKNKNRNYNSEWVFGFYNIYDRDNANSISFKQNDKTLKNEAVQLSIFGIVPSITYNFKF